MAGASSLKNRWQSPPYLSSFASPEKNKAGALTWKEREKNKGKVRIKASLRKSHNDISTKQDTTMTMRSTVSLFRVLELRSLSKNNVTKKNSRKRTVRDSQLYRTRKCTDLFKRYSKLGGRNPFSPFSASFEGSPSAASFLFAIILSAP